jgi:hypothetical protein
MRKPNKRESILLVVLSLAAVYTVSLDSKLARKRKLNSELRNEAKQQANQVVELGTTTQKPRLEVFQRAASAGGVAGSGFQHWNVDPFDRAFTREPVIGGNEDEGDGGHESASMKLHGVMVTRRGAAAMIDREIYKVGDRVRHYVVESITPGGVVLKNVVDGSVLRLEVD